MAFFPLQSQSFSLAGSGCSIGDTVLNLKSFKDINGVVITMSNLGNIAYITVEPGSGTQEEQISFTGVTQNTDGSAQLTGISTVLFKSPYTATSGFAKTHGGSVEAVLSNTAGFYTQFGILSDDEIITGNWQVPTGTPLSAGSIPSKAYVLSVINGGTVTTDQIVVAGVAGQNLTAGNVVYLKSDGAWYQASSAAAATCLNVQLGISQTTVTTSNTCSILLPQGTDKTQTGLTAGLTYYLGTAGALSTTPGTISISIGEAINTTNIQFKPGFTTGGATASITGVASMIPIAATGSSKLDASWIQGKFGGTGSDGALTVASGTSTINLGNLPIVIKNYTSIAITGTGQVNFSNPATNGTIIILKSQGAITLTSSTVPNIDASSMGAAAGSNGLGLTFQTNKGITSILATGALGGVSILATTPNIIYKGIPIAVGAGGGTGGNGSSGGTGGIGGVGGGALIFEAGGAWNFTVASGISLAGGAGVSGTSGNGAGGGGGGGGAGTLLALYSSLTANSGSVVVTGGIGGGVNNATSNGSTNGGGGGGGGSVATAGGNGSSGGTSSAGTTNNTATGANGGSGFAIIEANNDFF